MMRLLGIAMIALCIGGFAANAEPISIVAAENFYGDVAEQIGGPSVKVSSILANPDQDPHMFEASPSIARQLADARIVVFNGADYDPWIAKLLAGSPQPGRKTIEVAALIGVKSGANPHIWYDPNTMPRYAEALGKLLVAEDPAHSADYQRRIAAFASSLGRLKAKLDAMKTAYSGAPVTATEPVFGYMAAALGLEMRNTRFQLAIMNDTEPGASDVAAFENDLRNHRVRAFLYNNQTSGALAEKMKTIATESGVPVVGVSETEPPRTTYQAWMLAELSALDSALSGKQP
jgi:zinc/manganese transport system substrate-binding protein